MADILPDLPSDFEDHEVGFDDAFALAAVIMQMRSRVDDMEKILPGSRARTAIEIDDTSYDITLSRSKSTTPTAPPSSRCPACDNRGREDDYFGFPCKRCFPGSVP